MDVSNGRRFRAQSVYIERPEYRGSVPGSRLFGATVALRAQTRANGRVTGRLGELAKLDAAKRPPGSEIP